MAPRSRSHSSLLAAAAVAALFLAGCGAETGGGTTEAASGGDAKTTTTKPADDDGGDEGGDDTTTTEPSDDGDDGTTTTEGGGDVDPATQQAIDVMVETYTNMGMAEEDATCIAETLVAGGLGETTFQQADIMEALRTCGLDMADLQDFTNGLTENGGDLDSVIVTSIATSMEAAGLDADDAKCVAEAYVDEFGADDMTSIQDPTSLIGLLESCGVSLSELGG